MTDKKLSSAEVPNKFIEWLLAFGCSPEIVPTVDNIVLMCRGEYYIVWRSLIEHIEPKDIIKQKRLQVFCDDVRKWKRKNTLKYQQHSDAVKPDQISLWQQHQDVKDKVAKAEARMDEGQKKLKQLMDNISSKLCHRNLSQQRVQDLKRRVWLLQQVIENLNTKKQKLEMAKELAKSFSLHEEDIDVKRLLDKYISSLYQAPAQTPAKPSTSSAAVSTDEDAGALDNEPYWLALCRGDALWSQLYARRVELIPILTKEAQEHKPQNDSADPQRVLSHSASMHCSLALETMKCRIKNKQTSKKLVAAQSELNDCLPGPAFELLMLRSERSRAEARVNALRTLLAELTSRTGIFDANGQEHPTDNGPSTLRRIEAIDKSIESKKEGLQNLITSLTINETKIQNVHECLTEIFNSFHKDTFPVQHDKSKGQMDGQDSIGPVLQVYKEKSDARKKKMKSSLNLNILGTSDSEGQMGISQYSIAQVLQFYTERCDARKKKMELSLNLNILGSSDAEENRPPKFADELKIYLKKFSLEKNRSLAFENGEQMWIFESTKAAVRRLQAYWLEKKLPCTLLCPAEGVVGNLNKLVDQLRTKMELENFKETLHMSIKKPKINIDLSPKATEEEILDKIKKRLNENILVLQKTNTTLDGSLKDLQFWADNELKQFISDKRIINGKTYKDYELMYKENIRFCS